MHRFHRLQCYILLLLALLSTSLSASELNAFDVVEKSDQQMRGKSSYSEMTLNLIRPDWQRSMVMKSWTKDTRYSMVLITAPAKDKGIASLKRYNELWNWVPSVERVIKIAPSMLGQSWMGSDFTNDDLINQSSIVVDYTHKFAGEKTVDNDSCYLIDATPKPDAPVVWSKVRLAISKVSFNQREVMFYDEFGDRVNTLTTYDMKELGGRMIASRMVMQPTDKPGQYTEMITHKAEFDFDIGDDFFSLGNLKSLNP